MSHTPKQIQYRKFLFHITRNNKVNKGSMSHTPKQIQ
jgi:hypothetical protein